IVGDVRAVLRQMNVMLRSMDGNQGEMKGLRGPWLKQVAEWKRSHPLTYRQDDKINKPQFVIEKLYELTKHEAIVATDVDQHQMWAAQRSEEHTSELQSPDHLVCRLLLEKKKNK